MRPKYIVYGDNGRLLSRPIFLGDAFAVSVAQAINFVRHRKFPYKRASEIGFTLFAFIEGSADDLEMRKKVENAPPLPAPVPSSLV